LLAVASTFGPTAAGADLAGDDLSGAVTVKPSKELIEVGFSRAELADRDDLGRAIGAGVGDGDTLRMDVQNDEKGS
jgi:hypothetical protein